MKIKYAIGAVLALVCSTTVMAEVPTSGLGGTNFNLDVTTAFSYDCNDGSSGLKTTMTAGLWFEPLSFKDRGISPKKNDLSVSLKLSNSADYQWRGYTFGLESDSSGVKPDYVTTDQARSLWFDTFVAEIQYQKYWFCVAGIEPTLSVNQASLRSVFDNVMENNVSHTDKNSMPLPLFHTGSEYGNGTLGVVSVIDRDIVAITNDDCFLYGMYSAGYKGEDLSADIKVGAWKNGEDNEDNSWVFGGDLTYALSMVSKVSLSALCAINYDEIDTTGLTDAQIAGSTKLKENPLVVGASYEINLDMPRKGILKPFIGVDVDMPTATDPAEHTGIEVGGGATWYFRGTSAQFKRNTSIGGQKLGDVNNPAALCVATNIDSYRNINVIISANEDPKSSLLKNVGGFLQIEAMDINELNDHSRLIAGIGQLEYNINGKAMPYIYEKYIPGIYATEWTYGKSYHSFQSKVGVRFTPIEHFSTDIWYERNDTVVKGTKSLDDGLLTVAFGISL